MLHVSLFEGIHNDYRVARLPILFSHGSYISHPLPSSFTYIYIILHNAGARALTLDALSLRSAAGHELRDLGLPTTAFKSTIAPGQSLGLGVLRHLLTLRLRETCHIFGVQALTAHARAEGCDSQSEALLLDMEYPTGPLEDVELLPYTQYFQHRSARFAAECTRLRAQYGSLAAYANLHTYWGIQRTVNAQGTAAWVLREYMPKATALWLTTDKIKFQRFAHHSYARLPDAEGWWELHLPDEALTHGTYIELRVASSNTLKAERRVPALAHWVEQDTLNPGQWCARFWHPPVAYTWQYGSVPRQPFARIYEAHVGMAQNAHSRDPSRPDAVGSYASFAREVLPHIRKAGYTAVQLMGVPEHPLYKSFGYQVSSYFAPSSRFGNPDDFKALVDAAHGLGLAVILDIPHSHACANTEQGLAAYDSSRYFFVKGDNQWGTPSFDFSQEMVRRFLLSNCRWWMEEYRVDGFRFDAVGNIIYTDHGFGDDFSHVGRCFYTLEGTARADEDGILYLSLANALIHECNPQALTIAEEFSGMPGLTCAPSRGGLGFDYRFAMGIPDFWAKFLKEGREIGALWHEMTNHRPYDTTISYVECHDQSINGKDAMIWRIMGDAMYNGMGITQESWGISRGLALYKLMRLITLSTAHKGYLNFMGAEFGHPEWLDDASHAHRQWHLANDGHLKYSQLFAFDRWCMHTLVARRLQEFAHDPLLRLLHEGERTLAFERGRLLCAMNWHESQAQSALPIMVSPGKYVELCSTDDTAFGGHGNLMADGLEHFSDPASGIGTQRISLYLPPLTALILIRQ